MATSAPMDNKSFFTEYGEANRFSIHEVIGKGSYGVVCSATDNKTGEKVAIKMIDKGRLVEQADRRRVGREIRVLKRLSHQSVIRVFDVVESHSRIYVVMEYCESLPRSASFMRTPKPRSASLNSPVDARRQLSGLMSL